MGNFEVKGKEYGPYWAELQGRLVSFHLLSSSILVLHFIFKNQISDTTAALLTEEFYLIWAN